jgi:hypothetical protein
MEVITLFFYSFLHHVPKEGKFFEQIFSSNMKNCYLKDEFFS